MKSYMFKGIIFVSVVGTLLHFAYGWSGESFLVGLFTPINESTWEHMKLIFFVYYFFMGRRLKDEFPCIGSSMALGTIFGTFLIPVLFYTYTGILGYNIMLFDILTFYISVISAFYITYINTLSCKADKYKNLLFLLVCLLAVSFVIFTISPPEMALFVSP